MKKRGLQIAGILIVFVFSASFLQAQTNITMKPKSLIDSSPTLNESSYLTLHLLSPIDPINARYRIGYIQSINPNWKLGLDIAYGNGNISWTNPSGIVDYGGTKENYSLWEFRPELYHIINPSKKVISYLSGEMFYIHHNDIFHGNQLVPEEGGFFSYEEAKFRRQKFGMNLKTGLFLNAGKRLGVNMYYGFGFRFRNNTFSDVVKLSPDEDYRDMLVIDYDEIEGLKFGFNFSLGFKLFIKI